MSVDTYGTSNKFTCKICNVNYKSSQSLWNHKSKYHMKPINTTPSIPSGDPSKPSKCTSKPQVDVIENNKKYICKLCNKKLSRLDNLKRHEKTCKSTEK